MTEKNVRIAREVQKRLDAGESLRAIAQSMGTAYQVLQYHRRRVGAAPLRKAHTKGENHASWRGGFFVDRWGYKMVRSPRRGLANPYVPEHLLVAEERLGRRLKKGEVVHHIDCDKTNNGPDNLFVCSRSTHKILHGQLEGLAGELLRCGLVRWTGDGYELA
jgi:hypothetical protein